MNQKKILTVDDSKTVRLIIRKAFKPFDCEISEAGNGVEGLAMATKVMPDLIILDVTMPVMDGVEMLTKLKTDPTLKNIPVLMLTAEGGRDTVLGIAKLGIRGYVVKPFKEEAMLEKVGQIIELKPVSENAGKARSALDPVDLLVVDDKPAIIEQIQLGLKDTSWRIHSRASQGEAIDFCDRTPPDAMLVSLSLPEDSAVPLFRALRANLKTKFKPIFALTVKTDSIAQSQAQQIGFTAVITKPIDFAELKSKVIKTLNLDISTQYFRTDDKFLMIALPKECTAASLADVGQYLAIKLGEAVDAGRSRVIVDVHELLTMHMGVTKLLFQIMQSCQELGMRYALVGNPGLITEAQGFEETRNWHFFADLAAAKSHLDGAPKTPQLAEA